MFFNGNESKAGSEMTKENNNLKTATFAGGCFWRTESDFEKVKGVTEVISGYTGGRKENPGYKEVSAGTTDHVEAIQVIYDPAQITYKELLETLWRHIDPTDSGGRPSLLTVALSTGLPFFITMKIKKNRLRSQKQSLQNQAVSKNRL
jgi:peptide methionine sulfoxide reductase msrA/msrB